MMNESLGRVGDARGAKKRRCAAGSSGGPLETVKPWGGQYRRVRWLGIAQSRVWLPPTGDGERQKE